MVGQPRKGAFATDSAAPSAMSTEATSTFTLDLPTATTTESVLPSNSRPNKRVITGGSIAGVLVLLVFFLFFLLRRRRRQKNEGPDSKDFFRYRAQTPIFGTPASGVEPSFTAAKLVASPTERARQLPLPPSTQAGTPASLVPLRLPPTSATAPTNSGTVRGATRASPAPVARRMPVRTVPQTFTGTTNSAPLPSPRGYPPSLIPPVARPEPTSPPTPAPPLALNTSSLPPRDQKIPLTSSTASTLVPVSELDAVGRGNHNIHVLAQEVAAVLMQTRVHSGTPTGDENSENSLDRTESPAPPKYTRVSVV
ncbi:hypothetical protein DXG03_002366 [Asterophora parasitica]|uniref:Transmembrane protein n=1 Tax=Asterophora parasitica TaxID=117018 RepID=A0A9P7G2E7_9AGAR|nr:hypothetical protein DXG03_002366 [Asterophora parasitica]